MAPEIVESFKFALQHSALAIQVVPYLVNFFIREDDAGLVDINGVLTEAIKLAAPLDDDAKEEEKAKKAENMAVAVEAILTKPGHVVNPNVVYVLGSPVKKASAKAVMANTLEAILSTLAVQTQDMEKLQVEEYVNGQIVAMGAMSSGQDNKAAIDSHAFMIAAAAKAADKAEAAKAEEQKRKTRERQQAAILQGLTLSTLGKGEGRVLRSHSKSPSGSGKGVGVSFREEESPPRHRPRAKRGARGDGGVLAGDVGLGSAANAAVAAGGADAAGDVDVGSGQIGANARDDADGGNSAIGEANASVVSRANALGAPVANARGVNRAKAPAGKVTPANAGELVTDGPRVTDGSRVSRSRKRADGRHGAIESDSSASPVGEVDHQINTLLANHSSRVHHTYPFDEPYSHHLEDAGGAQADGMDDLDASDVSPPPPRRPAAKPVAAARVSRPTAPQKPAAKKPAKKKSKTPAVQQSANTVKSKKPLARSEPSD